MPAASCVHDSIVGVHSKTHYAYFQLQASSSQVALEVKIALGVELQWLALQHIGHCWTEARVARRWKIGDGETTI